MNPTPPVLRVGTITIIGAAEIEQPRTRGETKRLPCKTSLSILLSYDELSGELRWNKRGPAYFETLRGYKVWNAQQAGKLACSTISARGYLAGRIFDKRYYAHRLIWKLVTGHDPNMVDHIDGDRTNNKWENLRNVSPAVNNMNAKRPSSNKSGHIGIDWLERSRAWRAAIQTRGQRIHLGLFADINEAIAARKRAELSLGFHENHGREL